MISDCARRSTLAPAVEHPIVLPAADRAVQRFVHRLHQAVAFTGGDGDVCRLGPTAFHRACQPGAAVQRRFIGAQHVRPEVGVGPAGLDRQRGGCIVGHVDWLERFKPLLPILLVPCQQDGFLIGAGADDNFNPAISAGCLIVAILPPVLT